MIYINIIEKYKVQIAILEVAQAQALKEFNYQEVRELSTTIFQLCNAVYIEEGGQLRQSSF